MTIQFLTPWNGMSGIQTLAAPEEARLVAAGLARVYVEGMDNGLPAGWKPTATESAFYGSVAPVDGDGMPVGTIYFRTA